MSEHAFLAPSSAALTVHCRAAPRLQSKYPQEDTPEAIEGTAAHWVAAQRLHNQPVALGNAIPVVPEGMSVTQQMLDGAELVVQWRAALPEGVDLFIEKTLRRSNLHPTMNWGTPDYWAYDEKTKTAYLADYKFGHGTVDAFENWQCIDYVDKILCELGITALQDVKVEITVIRPRNYNAPTRVDTWKVMATDLVPYWDRLRSAYYEAAEPTSMATPGPWCNNQHCSARRGCTALRQAANRVIGEAETGVAHDLTADELGTELRILHEAKTVIDARIDGLQEQALALLQAGTNVPFWTVKYSTPRRVWGKSAAEVIALGEMMGLKLAKPPEPVTPVQAKKLGLSEELFNAYSVQPPGSPVLKPEVDARQIFSKEK